MRKSRKDTITPEEWFVLSMKDEGQFQDWINSLLKESGWLYFHAYDSRRSPEGFLDTHAVHVSPMRLLWAELKMPGKKPTPKQRRWLSALRTIAKVANAVMGREWMIVRLWYPTDRREILKTIRGG